MYQIFFYNLKFPGQNLLKLEKLSNSVRGKKCLETLEHVKSRYLFAVIESLFKVLPLIQNLPV